MTSSSPFESILEAINRAANSGSIDTHSDTSREKISKVFDELTNVLLANYPSSDGEDQVLRSKAVMVTVAGFTGHLVGLLASSEGGLHVCLQRTVAALVGTARATFDAQTKKEG